MQHPEVVPAEDKELTFWGNFFSPKRRPGREEVTTKYLTLFPKIEPGDFKVTGCTYYGCTHHGCTHHGDTYHGDTYHGR